ncbi:ACP S-malonyltransferase [Nocardia fluminea]|uniref:ACP S-malonyltransferase n=1 Tax=Nocardia fluminea TaxID=134984 RepID=UPI003D14303B
MDFIPNEFPAACFLFPGQGAYLEETFLELADRRPEVGRTFHEIDLAIAGLGAEPISPILLGGSPPSLKQLLIEDPDVLQLALFGTAVAVYRILTAEGVIPQTVAGHSLGEIAALVAGGAFTPGVGARIVHIRSQCLHGAADVGGMLAVRGTLRRAQALVDLMATEGLVIAVENGPRQTVLAGPHQELSRATDVARAAGLAGIGIASPYPFHSPLLADVADEFQLRLNSDSDIVRQPLRRTVYSPILQRFYTDDDDFAEILSSHLVLPVRFDSALRYLHEQGIETFIECGARDALTGIARRTLSTVTAFPSVVRDRRAGESRALLLPAARCVVSE